jgi:hypothetical protein
MPGRQIVPAEWLARLPRSRAAREDEDPGLVGAMTDSNGMVVPRLARRTHGPRIPSTSMLLARRRVVTLTDQPIRVTTTGAQELRLARDVLAFDELDLELHVLLLEGGGANVDIEVQTGMQTETTDADWVTLAAFARATSSNWFERKNMKNLLRYVRWNVTSIVGTGATFMIYGIGRRWSRG